MDAPTLSALLEVAHGEFGEDRGAMGLRVGQIGHGHGVLGADIAARAAIAAQRAGGLQDARGVHGLLEAHQHGGCDRGLAERGARGFKRAVFGQCGSIAVARRAQHRLRPLETEIEQAVGADRLGPGLVGKDTRIGAQGHARIDERAAAEPTADEHMDVGPDAEIEEAGAGAGAHLAAVQLQFAAQFRQASWEAAGGHFPAPLDNANALARARKPGGRDAAAIARADDNYVVGGLHAVTRLGQAFHKTPGSVWRSRNP